MAEAVAPSRELSDDAVLYLAESLGEYLRKPGNRGASFWLHGRDLLPGDRAAILTALGDLEASGV